MKRLIIFLVSFILVSPLAGQARRIKVSNPRFVQGLLFEPNFSLKPSAEITNLTDLEDEILSRGKPPRDSSDVRKILENGVLEVKAHLRGLDGPGSSLDLPNFQEILTKPNAKKLEELPSTPTLTSEYEVKITFSRASLDGIEGLPEELRKEDPQNLIIYSAEDYKIPKEHPYIAKPIKRNGKVVAFLVWRWDREINDYKIPEPISISEDLPQLSDKMGMIHAPAYIFARLFGITGVRIDLQEISPIAMAGGMESSNAFMVSLLSSASMLTGADLSWADIFVASVLLENKVLQGENSTGGQGHLSSILGGAYRHIWLSGKKDYYGALSIPLVSEQEFNKLEDFVENHMLLVQYGKKYEGGEAVETRAADFINTMWTDLLVEKDRKGFPLHQEKLGLTERYVKALQEGDVNEIITTIQRYVEIRNQLTLRWAEQVLKGGKDEWLSRLKDEYKEALALYGLYGAARQRREERLSKAKEAGNYTQLVEELALKRLRYIYGHNISVYTARAQKLIEEGQEEGFAFMPLGAGGPGAVMIAVAKDIDKLKKFLEGKGIKEITAQQIDEIRKIIRGEKNDTIKGYVPFRISNEGIEFMFGGNPLVGQITVDNYTIQLPAGGINSTYDQKEGDLK